MYIWFINEGIVDTSVKASPRVRATMNIQVFSPENIFEYFWFLRNNEILTFTTIQIFEGFREKSFFPTLQASQ